MTVRTAAGSRLFAPWVLLACACAVLMWLAPGEETVPYHIAWIGVALGYGLEPWPWRRTVGAVAAYTAVTGAILVARASTGVIGWGETAEIPLMAVLVLIVVANVRQRHQAFARLAWRARRERARAERREQLSRMTSHEMRTPATIAIGYVELLMAREEDPARREDIRVIRDELTRLVLVGDRLLRTMQMHDQEDLRYEDIGALLHETASRWSAIADREWVVACPAIRHLCSEGRLRASLDTLVENALRYTDSGDTIRLVGRREAGRVLIGVADSGPGMDEAMLTTIARGDLLGGAGACAEPYTTEDPKAQTGLGLALVQDATEMRGGRLVAGRSAEGGALVLMAVPRVPGRPGSVPATRAGAGIA